MPVEIGSRDQAIVARAPDVTWDAARTLVGRARFLRLDPGVHAISVGPLGTGTAASGTPLSATHVCAGPVSEPGRAEIISASGGIPGWLGPQGGTVLAKIENACCLIAVTTHGIGKDSDLPELRVFPIEQLDNPIPAAAVVAGGIVEPAAPREPVPLEAVLHIELQGDRTVRCDDWVGNLDRKLRIEAFGLRVLGGIEPGELEYAAFGPGGRQTPWVADGRLCGTRGRGLPLTGFAVRLVPGLADRFAVIYEGCFFSSGKSAPCRNGEPCVSAIADDPLQAIKVRFTEEPSPILG